MTSLVRWVFWVAAAMAAPNPCLSAAWPRPAVACCSQCWVVCSATLSSDSHSASTGRHHDHGHPTDRPGHPGLPEFFGAASSFAGLFDDIEARRAIVELRKRQEATDGAQTRLLAELQKSREDSARFQGKALDLESQLQTVWAELHRRAPRTTRPCAELS